MPLNYFFISTGISFGGWLWPWLVCLGLGIRWSKLQRHNNILILIGIYWFSKYSANHSFNSYNEISSSYIIHHDADDDVDARNRALALQRINERGSIPTGSPAIQCLWYFGVLSRRKPIELVATTHRHPRLESCW